MIVEFEETRGGLVFIPIIRSTVLLFNFSICTRTSRVTQFNFNKQFGVEKTGKTATNNLPGLSYLIIPHKERDGGSPERRCASRISIEESDMYRRMVIPRSYLESIIELRTLVGRDRVGACATRDRSRLLGTGGEGEEGRAGE